MCLKTRLVNAIVAVKQVRQRSQQRKRNVLSVSDRHVTKPKITFSTRTLESTSTSLQVKEQTLSCPATKAHEHCNSGGMSGRCSTRAHVSVPERQTCPDKRGPGLRTEHPPCVPKGHVQRPNSPWLLPLWHFLGPREDAQQPCARACTSHQQTHS